MTRIRRLDTGPVSFDGVDIGSPLAEGRILQILPIMRVFISLALFSCRCCDSHLKYTASLCAHICRCEWCFRVDLVFVKFLGDILDYE